MDKEKRRKVGRRIKEILEAHQTSQAELAKALARHQAISFEAAQVKVSRIIKGQFEADYDFWHCFYEMFKPNIGYLIAEKGEPYVKPFK
jgi:hypothetical protein